MTPERADEINSAMVSHAMFNMGLAAESLPSLKGYTLREMLDATEQVKAEDDAKPSSATEGKTIRFVCDERLIAALYTLTHYTPQDPRGAVESIASNDAAGVFVLCNTREDVPE